MGHDLNFLFIDSFFDLLGLGSLLKARSIAVLEGEEAGNIEIICERPGQEGEADGRLSQLSRRGISKFKQVELKLLLSGRITPSYQSKRWHTHARLLD